MSVEVGIVRNHLKEYHSLIKVLLEGTLSNTQKGTTVNIEDLMAKIIEKDRILQQSVKECMFPRIHNISGESSTLSAKDTGNSART